MALAFRAALAVPGIGWLGRFKTTPGWAFAVGALNLAGILYGFYDYLPQFARTPAVFWPFVPDSPLAVLWAQLALLAYWAHRWRGRRGEPPGVVAATLDALAVLGTVQVGLWTVYVLTAYAGAFDTFALNLNSVLLVAHAGMVGLGLLYLQGVRLRARARPRVQAAGLALATAYYLVQDALDYFGPDFMDRGCAMRPHMVPCDPRLEAALAGVTFGLTLAVAAGVALWLVLDRGRGRGDRSADGSA